MLTDSENTGKGVKNSKDSGISIDLSNVLHQSHSNQRLCPKDEKEEQICELGNSIENTVLESNIAKNMDSNDEKVKETKCYKTLKGICLTMFSALFFSITTVIVKQVKEVDPSQMAFIRFLGILLFTIPILLESKNNPFGPSNLRHWLILRGIAGASSLFFRYSALHYMSIANATVIVLSMPVFVFIFAKIFLKESFGLFNIFALFITLIGIAFTSKLAIIFSNTADVIQDMGIDSQREFIGLAFSLGATLIGSSAYVLVRKIRCLHHSVILFNFSWVAITETSIITLCLNDFKAPTDLTNITTNSWMLCLLAVFSFYGQLLLTKALQAEEAGLVSIIRASFEVIFAFIFQITLFNEMPDKWSIIGAILVMISVVLTSFRKWILTLPKDSKIRDKFKIITK